MSSVESMVFPLMTPGIYRGKVPGLTPALTLVRRRARAISIRKQFSVVVYTLWQGMLVPTLASTKNTMSFTAPGYSLRNMPCANPQLTIITWSTLNQFRRRNGKQTFTYRLKRKLNNGERSETFIQKYRNDMQHGHRPVCLGHCLRSTAIGVSARSVDRVGQHFRDGSLT